ncbi:hypothetical protein F0562_014355 [Nyssa sinensis]|uniref:Uncharacterized protein n=1 Tax=Nyssa sinensis TaxID=561372 RepID=A0A5J4ZQ42_9ASTE|nr:hypothetical protein F0562_014355 [Nyssa sinensis]
MASTSNSILSVQQQYIPLFDGKNYDFWFVKMKTILLSLDLWELVEKGYVEPNSSTTLAGAQQSQLKMQQQKNASALSKIQQGVSDSIFPIIMRATTAKEAWGILQQQFQGNLKEMELAKASSSDLVPTQEVAIEEEDLPSGSQQCSSQDQGTRPEKGKENRTGPKKGKDDISGMEEEEWIKYLPLYKAVDSGNWKAAEQILNSNPKALTARLSGNGTALHVATLAGHVKIVKELVKKMKAEDLVVLRSKYYNTALHDACSGRIKEIAKILVEANPVLLSTKGWIGRIPVVEAAFNGDKDMVHYLYSKTPKEALNLETRKMLLRACINADIYDTAFDLVSNSETLAASVDTGAALALNALAQKASAFPSGSQLMFWQWWIYSIICVEPLHASTNIVGDIESSHKGPSDRGIVIIRVLNQLIGCCGISSKLFATVPAIRRIYDEKVKHVQACKLLVHICEKISDRDPLQFISKEVYEAIVEATKNGIVEFIFEIVKLYPDIIWKSDNDGRIIFNYAILHRQEKIFSLLHVMGSKKNILAKKKDKDKNNMLHHAAILLHASSQLGRISGAALQMQRELQWLREVENIVQPEYKNMYF